MYSRLELLNQKHFFALCCILSLFIAGCEEDCPDPKVDEINAFYFQFKTSGGNSFIDSELDSVFMVRYNDILPDSFSFPVDTVNFWEKGFYNDEFQIRLSQGFPFPLSAPPYFPDYKYKIQSLDQDFEYTVERIELEGDYIGECDYINELKLIIFQGDSLDHTNNDQIIFLEKP